MRGACSGGGNRGGRTDGGRGRAGRAGRGRPSVDHYAIRTERGTYSGCSKYTNKPGGRLSPKANPTGGYAWTDNWRGAT
ncbi:hypothetical protein RHMOL_Rhmol03G0067600 [Rhododendron molle]|uniref:Uncharacterized protein n=1 Tax=Rhododendron molle TaxID=49168 RepID=A0ACC0PAZ6_RHOML|nr:hypothetical protein RHMOL_Rhmol03G0067600 [Rhododendron molle]